MNRQVLGEIVLWQLECVFVVQELTQEVAIGNESAVAFLNTAYRGRPSINWRDLLPFANLKTTLSMLLVPFAFANSLSEQELAGAVVRSEHELIYRERGVEVATPNMKQILTVLRNAIAHLPDFAAGKSDSPNISFDEGILRCWSKRPSGEVVFQSEAGFIEFLRDLLPVIRRACRPTVA